MRKWKPFFWFWRANISKSPSLATSTHPSEWAYTVASKPASQQSIYLSINRYIDVVVIIQADVVTLHVIMVACKLRRTCKLTRNAQHKTQHKQASAFVIHTYENFPPKGIKPTWRLDHSLLPPRTLLTNLFQGSLKSTSECYKAN